MSIASAIQNMEEVDLDRCNIGSDGIKQLATKINFVQKPVCLLFDFKTLRHSRKRTLT